MRRSRSLSSSSRRCARSRSCGAGSVEPSLHVDPLTEAAPPPECAVVSSCSPSSPRSASERVAVAGVRTLRRRRSTDESVSLTNAKRSLRSARSQQPRPQPPRLRLRPPLHRLPSRLLLRHGRLRHPQRCRQHRIAHPTTTRSTTFLFGVVTGTRARHPPRPVTTTRSPGTVGTPSGGVAKSG
jgi:hypothetical protein